MFHFHHVRANGAVGGGGIGGVGPGGGGGTAGAGANGGAISILAGANGENGPKNGFCVPSAGCIFDAITVPKCPGKGAICNAKRKKTENDPD